ncbi:hypothetical protein K9N68_35195 (plasmid) [Kovacikia minuta CCNUW1]|uniref:hypothetical protein n=1 Tax=Kovacikia minuta TaxID=2931930 RepID=UPI001CC9FE8B|nr:hypothetical protein [Kovacikia minuta]UBF30443.1 hypothetical protein K9N68_35195 [Kovacikia minuta CCNUW1]
MAARSKTATVKQKALSNTASFLTELPEKTKEEMSLREAVKQMQPQLKAALAKGYSYQDLATMLTDLGIKISALTLRNYLPSGKRQAGKAARRPRKAASREAVAAPPADSAGEGEEPAPSVENGKAATTAKVAESEAVTTATRGRARRGQAKSAAKATGKDEPGPKSARAAQSSAKSPRTRRKQ